MRVGSEEALATLEERHKEELVRLENRCAVPADALSFSSLSEKSLLSCHGDAAAAAMQGRNIGMCRTYYGVATAL